MCSDVIASALQALLSYHDGSQCHAYVWDPQVQCNSHSGWSGRVLRIEDAGYRKKYFFVRIVSFTKSVTLSIPPNSLLDSQEPAHLVFFRQHYSQVAT